MIKFIKNNMSKLADPKLCLLSGIIVCSFIFIVVVPVFKEIFDSLGVDLPQITKGILYLSKMWFVILLPISVIYFYIVIGKNSRIINFVRISAVIIGLLLLVTVIALFMPMLEMRNISNR
ncbi:MAG: hypothetical protein HY919_05315 [Elusimicrobia bacterium]|nr:hypothetical protein [Elusimicrobiota bacterium]